MLYKIFFFSQSLKCIFVAIFRKELVSFDRSQSEQTTGDTLPVYAGLLQNYDGEVTKGKKHDPLSLFSSHTT